MRTGMVLSLVAFAAILTRAPDPPLPADLRALVSEATYGEDGEATTLKGVMIADRPIADEDLALLKRYPSLRGLDLQLLSVTGNGLAQVAQLADLERLRVYKCDKLRDEDFAQLGKLKKLRVLSVSATDIGDDGLKQVCTLPELEYLNIGDTKITDAGLVELKKLKKLKVLVTWGPQVSAERRKELEAAIPRVKFGDVTDLPDPIYRQ